MNAFWISISAFLCTLLIMVLLVLLVTIEYLRLKEELNAKG